MKYFAYGSNMLTNWLRERVPSCKFVTLGVLKSHKLRFHKKSKKDESGKCNAFYTGLQQDEVLGVVFEIDSEEKSDLDKAERGYEAKYVKVHCGDITIEALTYIAAASVIDDSLIPYTWYKDLVLDGANEHNLPRAYIEQIERIPAKADSDKSRDQKNRRIIGLPRDYTKD
ncbi:MAG: gamma-glutamylcyclotransferase [Sedimentisphaerales bacterium]|nr:gamma-glutamylcyclotransferase [Sedimentisphaerales bacterium]